jgi:hypothetical protein
MYCIIIYDHLVYFTAIVAIRYMLRLLWYIFFLFWYIFFLFWYIFFQKNLATLRCEEETENAMLVILAMSSITWTALPHLIDVTTLTICGRQSRPKRGPDLTNRFYKCMYFRTENEDPI